MTSGASHASVGKLLLKIALLLQKLLSFALLIKKKKKKLYLYVTHTLRKSA